MALSNCSSRCPYHLQPGSEQHGNADDKAAYTGFFAITPPPPSDPSTIEADGGKWIRLPGRLVEYFVHGSTKTDAAILVDCPGGGCTGALVGKLPGVAEWCRGT